MLGILLFLMLFLLWRHSLRQCLVVILWFWHSRLLHIDVRHFQKIQQLILNVHYEVYSVGPTPTTVVGVSHSSIWDLKLCNLLVFISCFLWHSRVLSPQGSFKLATFGMSIASFATLSTVLLSSIITLAGTLQCNTFSFVFE